MLAFLGGITNQNDNRLVWRKVFQAPLAGGEKHPPQTPPLASTQQTSKIKRLDEWKFRWNFVLFLPIFALNLIDFQRFFYVFSEVFNVFCMEFEASCVRFWLWLVSHEIVIQLEAGTAQTILKTTPITWVLMCFCWRPRPVKLCINKSMRFRCCLVFHRCWWVVQFRHF